MAMADDFDVIHNHMDYLAYPLAAATPTPFVTTLHGRLDLPELPHLYEAYRDLDVISISDAQREPLPHLSWRATVYHGLPNLFSFAEGRGGYLAFLGRVSPEKRVDSAIRVAEMVGIPLKIAAKVDPADQTYFEEVIQPMLKGSLVEFVGEIGETDKQRFLGDAVALLMPIDWPEPFGIVVAEALACGTPVIARRRGSMPELIADGETGMLCEDETEMAEAVGKLSTLDRRRCRAAFESRFTAERMAKDYLRVYDELVMESQRGAA
jgi:glycosyltransferase involved in cell wall biosynthesis